MYECLCINEDSYVELRHNFEEEDYITFNIISKNDSMFYVEAKYEINGIIGRGWISRNTPLKIYARNYNQSLNLYSCPTEESSIKYIIEQWITEGYDVIDYYNLWLKVKININGKEYEGWMPPNMQCNNPYSTCG